MISVELHDPVNSRILAISEDKIAGFSRAPFREIARRADVPLQTVIEEFKPCSEPAQSAEYGRLC